MFSGYRISSESASDITPFDHLDNVLRPFSCHRRNFHWVLIEEIVKRSPITGNTKLLNCMFTLIASLSKQGTGYTQEKRARRIYLASRPSNTFCMK